VRVNNASFRTTAQTYTRARTYIIRIHYAKALLRGDDDDDDDDDYYYYNDDEDAGRSGLMNMHTSRPMIKIPVGTYPVRPLVCGAGRAAATGESAARLRMRGRSPGKGSEGKG
jgi:hypothetical protein